jgi:RimJ/RimL family protein N-acetyltransferase
MDIYFGKIKLRALEPEDMEALRATVNDPEMEKMVVGWSFPVSKRQQMSWYERVIGNPTNHRFAVEYEGKFVGISTLTDIDWKNRSAFHGVKLTQDAPKRMGLGFDAVVAVMKYAFEELQLNRLFTGILEYNIPSQKLYEKCGWVAEGRYRQCVFKENAYYDEIPVAILRDEYFEWKKKNGIS